MCKWKCWLHVRLRMIILALLISILAVGCGQCEKKVVQPSEKTLAVEDKGRHEEIQTTPPQKTESRDTSLVSSEVSPVQQEKMNGDSDKEFNEEFEKFWNSLFETPEPEVASNESKASESMTSDIERYRERAREKGYEILRQEGDKTIVGIKTVRGEISEYAVPTEMMDGLFISFTLTRDHDGNTIIVPFDTPTSYFVPAREFAPPPEIQVRLDEISDQFAKLAQDYERRGINKENVRIPDDFPPEYQALYREYMAIKEDPSNWEIIQTKATITIGRGTPIED